MVFVVRFHRRMSEWLSSTRGVARAEDHHWPGQELARSRQDSAGGQSLAHNKQSAVGGTCASQMPTFLLQIHRGPGRSIQREINQTDGLVNEWRTLNDIIVFAPSLPEHSHLSVQIYYGCDLQRIIMTAYALIVNRNVILRIIKQS